LVTSTPTTGVATTGAATTGVATTGVMTTGVATTGAATTGVATTGVATTGVATTGVATTGVATTGVATTGVATTGVATTGVATTGVATTGVATTGVATTGAATTGVATTGVATTGVATTGVATTGAATTGVATTGVATTECAALGYCSKKNRKRCRTDRNCNKAGVCICGDASISCCFKCKDELNAARMGAFDAVAAATKRSKTKRVDTCANNITADDCADHIGKPSEDCNGGSILDSLIFDGSTCSNASCLSTCGNNVVEVFEECDDGNTNNGDGCSADCRVEGVVMDPLPGCGTGCLSSTAVGAFSPLLAPNEMSYTIARAGATCDATTVALFDIPACTDVVSVVGDCVTNWNVPCAESGHFSCLDLGACTGQWAPDVRRPLVISVNDSCTVTVAFANDMAFTTGPIGLGGGGACSSCETLVPSGCFAPGANVVIPNYVCSSRDIVQDPDACFTFFGYDVVGDGIVQIPRGISNRINPISPNGVDNLPTTFDPADTTVYYAYVPCEVPANYGWFVDNATALAVSPGASCPDCDGNGIADYLEIALGSSPDCNRNNVPDACDIASGASIDSVGDGVPDECRLEAPPGGASGGDLPTWVIILIVVCAVGCCCCAWFVLCASPDRRRRRRRHTDAPPMHSESFANAGVATPMPTPLQQHVIIGQAAMDAAFESADKPHAM